ncbi:MAG: acyl-CoA dehydrogenase family protein [Acidimicrobiales bacterium]
MDPGQGHPGQRAGVVVEWWGALGHGSRRRRPARPGLRGRRDRRSHLRHRLVDLHIEAEILRLIRLRTVTARIKGNQPGPEASIRKIMADEHGQRIMALAKDLAGPAGMLTDVGPLGSQPGPWHHGYLFAPALTVGGGTGEVQRNIIAERVLGLPHDVDVEVGRTWAESRRPPAGVT